MKPHQLADYRKLIDEISKRAGRWMFWYKPRYGQYYDIRMRKNVQLRMEEGATLKDLLHVLTIRCREYEDHKNLTKSKVIGFYSKKNFWKHHPIQEEENE